MSQKFIKFSGLSSDRIMIRQTLDPCVNDVQYIAWREVALESNGSLRMDKIGLGMPGDDFVIAYYAQWTPTVIIFTPSNHRVQPADLRSMVSYEDAPYPILTVVERRDANSASERNRLRFHDKARERRVAYWKGLAAQAWNCVALPLSSMSNLTSISRHHDSIPIPPKNHQPEDAVSVSVSVPNKANTFGLVHRRQTAKVGDFGIVNDEDPGGRQQLDISALEY